MQQTRAYRTIDSNRMQTAQAPQIQTAIKFPGITITSSIPTGSARVASEPAEAAQLEGRDPDGSMHFTPAQQAVAAALMVVMMRAQKEGREAALAAKQTLVSNNPATQPFLDMLPDDGPLPTMQHVKQEASDQLLHSLTKLAKQCSAAHCQPLEVFTRSVLCTTHQIARESLATKGRYHQRQRQLQQLDKKLAQFKSFLTRDGPLMECLRGLEELGVPGHVATLTMSFLQIYRLLRDKKYWKQPATEHRSDLDHLLPGALDVLVENTGADFSRANVLIKLVPSITAALQAYQARAAQCGQSFEHMVWLEAAVQGWPLAIHAHACDLLFGMIKAEPPAASAESSLSPDASQAASSAAAEVPPEEGQVLKHPAMEQFYKCPSDVATILLAVLDIMDLSPIPELSPVPPRALNEQKKNTKALLTEKLFPGTMEELYCAVDSSNADMCPGLIRAAARHIESYITVWITNSDSRESIKDIFRIKHEVLLSELPLHAESAIDDMIARVNICDDFTADLHDLTTRILLEMAKQHDPGSGATVDFWSLKALTQLIDLKIYHPADGAAAKAVRTLLRGEATSQTCTP
ncbi:g5538 [Coccomyxa viridis]|uniref:G5538 protein n=1 Tax=Coccomyxa viridis TaxID=1274662 RepID=A0ABP1FVC8_9CHLO